MRANAPPVGADALEELHPVIRGPEDVVAWARRHWIGWDERVVLALTLSRAQRLVWVRRLGEQLREVEAIKVAQPKGDYPGMILVVTRPGETTLPTEHDIIEVERLQREADQLGVVVVDCLIVGEHRWRSILTLRDGLDLEMTIHSPLRPE